MTHNCEGKLTVWFVSRHPGAICWVKNQDIKIDNFTKHLDFAKLKPGDRVIGTLPINVIAKLCEKDIEYWNLSLELPFNARGKELTAHELEQYGARLERYRVEKLNLTWESVLK